MIIDNNSNGAKGMTAWGKVIQRELCKKWKFDHTTKWYMHQPESFQENKMHKILCDLKIQADNQIMVRRPGRVII